MFFFLLNTLLEITYRNYIFLKTICVVTLIYIYIWLYMKMHHIWYYIWKNAWIVDMSIFYFIFDKEIMDFMVYYKI